MGVKSRRGRINFVSRRQVGVTAESPGTACVSGALKFAVAPLRTALFPQETCDFRGCEHPIRLLGRYCLQWHAVSDLTRRTR